MVAAIDTNQLHALKPSQTDTNKIAHAREAAKQFESFFLSYLMKEMKQNTLESGLFGNGMGADTYTDLFNEKLSEVMAERGGIGLADMLVKHLEPDSKTPEGKTKTVAPLTSNNKVSSSTSGVTLSSTGQMVMPDMSLASQQPHKAFMDAIAASIATIGKSDLAKSGIMPESTGEMMSPLDSGYISSGFGTRRDPINGSQRFHEGIDIAAPIGTQIHAVDNGKVVFAGKQGGYGNTVIIEHSNGVRTRYAHAESLSVSVGDVVEAGQVVGKVGSTGRSTGPHLHFEVIGKDGQHLNPGKFISKVVA
jgi:flagellar protein FlgJ